MTAYLHIDLGTDRDAYFDLIDEVRRLGAKPSEQVNTAGTPIEYRPFRWS